MKVVLTPGVWDKMRAYVDNCKDEISGLGKIERDDDDNFVITDIALFKQTVSAAHSDISAEALAKFQVELIKKGDNPADWSFWWHSHAAMAVFFSSRDTSTIDESSDFSYLVSLVTNHAHDLVARVDTFKPVRLHATIEVEVQEWEDSELIAACIQEIADKVSKPAPLYPAVKPWKGNRIGYNVNATLPYQSDWEDRYVNGISDIPYKNEYLKRADALDDALNRVGTDEYAEAIDTYYTYRDELEIEVELCVEEEDAEGEKEAKRKYFELLKVGREHNLEGVKLI